MVLGACLCTTDGMEDLIHHTVTTSSITKWIGETVEEIIRDSRDRAIDEDNWCEVLLGRIIVIPDGTVK